jgi:hypothetical protein
MFDGPHIERVDAQAMRELGDARARKALVDAGYRTANAATKGDPDSDDITDFGVRIVELPINQEAGEDPHQNTPGAIGEVAIPETVVQDDAGHDIETAAESATGRVDDKPKEVETPTGSENSPPASEPVADSSEDSRDRRLSPPIENLEVSVDHTEDKDLLAYDPEDDPLATVPDYDSEEEAKEGDRASSILKFEIIESEIAHLDAEDLTTKVEEFSDKLVEGALPEATQAIVSSERKAQAVDDAATIIAQGALQALRDGDANKATTLIDELHAAPDPDDAIAAHLYTIGRAGSEHANARLHEKLASGQQAVQEEIAGAIALFPDNPYPYIPHRGLDEVVDLGEANGAAPEEIDELIDKYSDSDEDRWIRRLAHCGQEYYSKPDATDAEVKERGITQMIDELTATDQLPESFVYTKTPELLAFLPNDELRAKVVNRFLEIESNQPQNAFNLGIAYEAGRQVLFNPTLGRDPVIVAQFQERLADRHQQLLAENPEREYLLNVIANDWRLTKTWHEGATPKQVIEQAGELITEQIRSNGAPNSGEELAEMIDKKMVPTRDRHFSLFASQAASDGDFERAQTYTSNISDNDAQIDSLAGNLLWAETGEQVDSLRPDVLALTSNPHLQWQMSTAGALLSNHPLYLTAAAEVTAEHFRVDHPATDNQNLGRILQRVIKQDEAAALRLTSSIYTKLVERGANWSHIAPYAAILLKSGIVTMHEIVPAIPGLHESTRVPFAVAVMKLRNEMQAAPALRRAA